MRAPDKSPDPKNIPLSVRIGQDSDRKLDEYAELTGVGKSTIAALGIAHIIHELDFIKEQLQTNDLGKNIPEMFDLMLKNTYYTRFAFYPLRDTYKTMPPEDRLMFELAVEKAKSKRTKLKGDTRQ